ncbi:MAG TPA: ATP-binding protein [Leptospiraceae bacterium]|nr:ATP-binding protein [Leptospiraceae bacterium]HNF26707.1 ATP-binding protein [Leptospiraceae bacterium]HNM05641.1 ATP-binding protein [Leptospiraceae bacterium]HNN04054.1 ATP-binding protein [Leptospiraceae bacterium]
MTVKLLLLFAVTSTCITASISTLVDLNYKLDLLLALQAFFPWITFLYYYRKSRRERFLELQQSTELKMELEYRAVSDYFKNNLFTLNQPEKIFSEFQDFILSEFHPEFCDIFYWSDEQGQFILIGGKSRRDYEEKFMLFDPMMIWLTELERLLNIDRIRSMAPPDIADRLEFFFLKYHISLLIPFTMNQGLIGYALLGKRKSGDYKDADFRRLAELRSVAVMALSNSIFYSKLIMLTETLEEKVQERTKELRETQEQLVLSEKMASLGVMVAGVAHEINTPSGVISSSSELLDKHIHSLFSHLQTISGFMQKTDLSDKLENAANLILNDRSMKVPDSKEKFRQRKILREKFTAGGLPAADSEDLANFIIDRSYFELEEILLDIVKETGKAGLEFLKTVSAFSKNIAHIRYAIENITRIVRALKQYSHSGRGTFEPADICTGIDNALILLQGQTKHGIEVIKEFHFQPQINCNQDELTQVWTNLMQNSIHAMNGSGTLKVSIRRAEDMAEIRISDTGSGIPKEIQDKIWDPFFTTKDQGQGTGLGLGIVKNILEKHKAKISVESVPGSTVFTVLIPLDSKENL